MKESTRYTNPVDIESERRAVEFHKKLALIRNCTGEPSWKLVVKAAAASHFLWNAKNHIAAPTPNISEAVGVSLNLRHLAKGGQAEGGVISISKDAAQEMIFRTLEDPDYFEGLKKFCGHALTGEIMPHSGGTTFELHKLLSRWIGNLILNEIRKPKTRKQQILTSTITNEAIANTVQFLKDNGVPIFKNDATFSSINACDAVAEISGKALGRKKITGDAVKKIYYASEWGKLKRR